MKRFIQRSLIIHVLFALTVVGCSQEPVKKIAWNQLDTRIETRAEKTPLMRAAEQGTRLDVKNLLQEGALLNAVTPEGSAFSLALKNGHSVIAHFLLSAGADYELGFAPGAPSALMLASENAMNKLVKELILKGAPLDYTDSSGYSALALAANRGHLTTMKILINSGADVDATPEGKSLLMHVVEANNMLLTQLLIAADADVNYRDENGDNALRIARRNGYYDLDLMLVQAGARP